MNKPSAKSTTNYLNTSTRSARSALTLSKVEWVKISAAAKALGVSIDTLRRWEKSGKITPIRTPGGTRLYHLSTLKKLSPASVEDFQAKSQTTEELLLASQGQALQDYTSSVIPANTGIQLETSGSELDPDFRRDDNTKGGNDNIKKSFVAKFLISSAILSIITLLLTSWITASYLTKPKETAQFFKNNIASGILSPFHLLAEEAVMVISPEKAKELGFIQRHPGLDPGSIQIDSRFRGNDNLGSSNVLAVTASPNFLEVNSDTQVNGSLFVRDSINGLALEATPSAGTIDLTAGNTTLTITKTAKLDQDVSTTATPTFNTLNLSATKDQLVFQSGGPTGTLTWTPTATRTITLPDVTTTLVGIDNTQTLTNKSISGSSNALTNIPNSALTNSKVTVTAGTNLTGGGDVTLGSSITIALKDSPSITSLTTTGIVSLADGTAAAPALTFTSDTNTGLYRVATDTLGFVTAGVERFNISSSGHVLPTLDDTYTLGSSSFRWLKVWAEDGDFSDDVRIGDALTVEGSLVVSGTTLATTGNIETTGNLRVDGNTILGDSSSSDTTTFNSRISSDFVPSSDNAYNLGSTTLRWRDLYLAQTAAISGNLGIGVSFAQATLPTNGLAVQGNVGIGTTTANYNLSVVGTTNITGNTTIGGTTTFSTMNPGSILFAGTAGILSQNTANFYWDNTNNRLGIGTSAPSQSFQINTNTSNPVVITSGGNVGIGITSPQELLHIYNPSNIAKIRLETGSLADYVIFDARVGTVTNTLAADSSKGMMGTNSNHPLSIRTNSTERMRITSDGNVGIGYNSIPGATLAVNGNVGIGTSSAGTNLQVTGNGSFGYGAGTALNGSTSLAVAGNIGIGTTSPAANLHVVGTSQFNGNSTYYGNVLAGTDITYDLGSAAVRWNNLYAYTITATNIAGVITGGSTSSTDWLINSTNTSDSNNSSLSFKRGSPTNAVLQWYGLNNTFDFNSGIRIGINNGSSSTIESTTGLVLSGFSNDITTGTNEHLSLIPDGTGNVGIGTSSPGALLGVLGGVNIGGGTFRFAEKAGPTNGLAVEGNVGIGTTTTSHNLEVIGTGAFSSTLSLANGSATTPALNFSNLTNAGLWTNGDGLLLTTGGTNTSGITVTGSGNVGIGTTAPQYALDIVGNSALWQSVYGTDDGLVGYWPFSEGTGTKAYDRSPYGNDGTLTGATGLPTWSTGKYGNALSFDGVDDYVGINYSASLNNTNAITVEAWIYPLSLRSGSEKWDDLVYGADAYVFGIDNGQLNPHVSVDGSWRFCTDYFNPASVAISLNQWQHITLTYDSATRIVSGYYNGKVVCTNTLSGLSTYNIAELGAGGIQIGVPGTWIFNGTIDEVRVYNRALSADEIKTHYLRGKESGKAIAMDTSTTAGNLYGLRSVVTDTGIVTTGTDTTYGSRIDVTRTGATGGIINTYGEYVAVTGDTGGTSTAIGGYFSATGADNNYGLIVGNGNVGIGTTGPGSALTVIGNVGIGTSAAGAGLQVNGGGLFGWGTASVAAPANGLAVFGNVGIGTTSPTYQLQTTGNVGIGSSLTVTSAGVFGSIQDNGSLVVNGTSFLQAVNTGNITAGTYNGNTITTGTGTLTLGAGKTLTLNDSTTLNTNAITFAGTESLTLTAAKSVSFADAFTTSGAFPLTLTTTASTNVTLPTTGTLTTLAGTETLSGKTFSGNTFFPGSGIWGTTGNVGIGTTAPLTTLDVRGTIENGLVGWWSFDEGGSATTTADQSINANTGTLGVGTSAPTWVTGKFSNALSFDGGDDYVSVGNNTVFNMKDFTLEAWVKTSNAGTARRRIISRQQNGPFDLYFLSFESNAPNIGMRIESAGGSNNFCTSADTANDGNWHHIIGVRDTTASVMRIYDNGVLKNTCADAVSASSIVNSEPLYIGFNGSGENFNGTIDEVRIYNRALSKREIAEHYRQQAPSLAQGGTVSGNFYVLSGNVGIGTASPTDKLIVSGGNVGIGVSSPLTALAVNGAGTIGWGLTGVAGPTNGLAVSGNLGIGTTSPNNKLQVIGAGVFGGDYGAYTAPSNGLLVQGNVGIGTSNGTGAYALDVNGTIRSTGLITPYQHTITVAKSGGDYITITAALNAITDNDSTHLYLIKVMPGIYSEQVTMKQNVDIIGSGQEVTKITQTNTATGVVIGATNARMEGFELNNANVNQYSGQILVFGSTSPTFKNIKFTTNVVSGESYVSFGNITGSPVLDDIESNLGGHFIYPGTSSTGTLTLRNSRLNGIFALISAFKLRSYFNDYGGGGVLFNWGTAAADVISYGDTNFSYGTAGATGWTAKDMTGAKKYTNGPGSDITNKVVYLSTTDTVNLADADDTTKIPAIGVVIKYDNASTVWVKSNGSIYDQSNPWIAGSTYYLSATAGELTTDPGSGANAQVIGVAKSAYELVLTLDTTGAKSIYAAVTSPALAVTQAGSGYAATFSGGNVGIGTAGPGSALTVIGNVGIGTSAAGAALQVNGGGLFGWGTASVAAPVNGLAVSGNVGIGTTSPGSNKLKVVGSLCVKADDAACAGSTAGTIYATNTVVQTADVAELYPSNDNLEAGEIVSVDKANGHLVSRTNQSYDRALLGIVSTKAGVTLGSDKEFEDIPHFSIALAGRVPVKVSTENGPIEVGDYITSSATSGVAMKATRPGQVVGKALEAFPTPGVCEDDTPGVSCQGKILAFVNVTFADPGNFLASLSMDDQGNMIIPKIRTSSLILDPSVASASSQLTNNESQIMLNTDPQYTSPGPNLASNTNNYIDLSGEIASLESRIQNSEFRIKEQQAQIKNLQDILGNVGIGATASAQIASSSASIASDSATVASSLPPVASDLNLTPPDILINTGSAVFTNLSVKSEATISGQLVGYDLSVSNTLKSLGKTNLADTNIAGILSVDGTLSIENGNEINVLGTLYLQKAPLATGVDIFNGKLTIDPAGNIQTQGKIIASEIKTNKLTISDTPIATSSATLAASIGTATLPANSTAITIQSTNISDSAKVFITPTSPTDKVLSVTNIKPGISFDVSVLTPPQTDINFNWWIVQTN